MWKPVWKDINIFKLKKIFLINLVIDSLQKKNHFDIDCLYHRQGNEQKQVAVRHI
jgi:hypothetical protein